MRCRQAILGGSSGHDNAMTRPVLVAVLAHPDDESFAMGGTLAKYAKEGVTIVLIVATHGEAGIRKTETSTAARVRDEELRAACEELGVATVRNLGYPDGHLKEAEETAAVRRLLEEMRRFLPSVVVTFGPDGVSGHPDHVAIGQWTTKAFRAYARKKGSSPLLYYIVPSEATRQGCGVSGMTKQSRRGHLVSIDIEAFRLQKVRASQKHRSQRLPFSGEPGAAAANIARHEVFRLVWPERVGVSDLAGDLFQT